MHGGPQQGQRTWRPGRGFNAQQPYTGTSEPEEPAADHQPVDPEPDERSPEEQWAGTQADLTSAYQQRLKAHNKEFAKLAQQARGAEEQAKQWSSSGRFGLKEFWKGRPELTGTPAYNANWMQLNRPAVQRGVGGGAGFSGVIQRAAQSRYLGKQEQGLREHGNWLRTLGDIEAPQPTLSDSAGMAADVQAGADPRSVLRLESSSLVKAPASRFPGSPRTANRWAGSKPRGTQFSGVVFQPLD